MKVNRFIVLSFLFCLVASFSCSWSCNIFFYLVTSFKHFSCCRFFILFCCFSSYYTFFCYTIFHSDVVLCVTSFLCFSSCHFFFVFVYFLNPVSFFSHNTFVVCDTLSWIHQGITFSLCYCLVHLA